MSKFVSVQKVIGGFIVDNDSAEGPQVMTSLQKVMAFVRASLTEVAVEEETNDE